MPRARRLLLQALIPAALLTATGATGQDLAGPDTRVVAAPAAAVEDLTPDLLERLRYGRAVHEEFATGDGCAECHARGPRPIRSLRPGVLDSALRPTR
jgi:hypothetical protein